MCTDQHSGPLVVGTDQKKQGINLLLCGLPPRVFFSFFYAASYKMAQILRLRQARAKCARFGYVTLLVPDFSSFITQLTVPHTFFISVNASLVRALSMVGHFTGLVSCIDLSIVDKQTKLVCMDGQIIVKHSSLSTDVLTEFNIFRKLLIK